MRFIGYIRAVIRGAKIDWETPIEVSAEARRALLPQSPESLRVGRLKRPFHVKPSRLGGRGHRQTANREEVVHPKGALIFATLDESYFLVGAEDVHSE